MSVYFTRSYDRQWKEQHIYRGGCAIILRNSRRTSSFALRSAIEGEGLEKGKFGVT